jgi:hypothetical protein
MLSLAYLLIATAGQRVWPMGYTSTGLKVNVVRVASYADSGHSRAFTQPGPGETRRLSIPCRLAVRETGPVIIIPRTCLADAQVRVRARGSAWPGATGR